MSKQLTTTVQMPIANLDPPRRDAFKERARIWPSGLGELLNAAYQAMHPDLQDFDTLASRGGIGWTEGIGLLFDWYDRAEHGQRVGAPPPDVKAPGR